MLSKYGQLCRSIIHHCKDGYRIPTGMWSSRGRYCLRQKLSRYSNYVCGTIPRSYSHYNHSEEVTSTLRGLKSDI